MAFDFKKEYKEFYMPARKPALVTVPPMNYVAVRGKGNPNQEGSEYKRSIDLLYGIAYTIKMSKLGDHRIEGYFDYDEGLCVQCMHVGSYDSEPDTIAAMEAFATSCGHRTALSSTRHHHEIYLNDPRKAVPEKLKTAIRIPVSELSE